MKAAGAGGAGVMKGAVKRDAGAAGKAAKPAAPSSREARVDKKLKELASVSSGGVSKVIKEGLRPFTPKKVNGVVVAARLEKLNKEGKLSGLDGRQMRRAQNAFNRGKFTASVAPQSFARQESIRLAVKSLHQKFDGGNPVSKVKSAQSSAKKSASSAPAAKRAPKLDPMQRSEAKAAKRRYGVHSTIANPGKKSRRAPRVTAASGARVAVTGRSRGEIKAAQKARIATMGSAASRRNNIKVTVTGTQGGLFGKGTTLKRYKAGKRK